MGNEQKLEIKTVLGKDGKEYNNLHFKPKPLQSIKGLEEGNYAIVEKMFVEGFKIDAKFGVIYACKAKYDSKEVSFILNQKEHEMYKNVGGVGDKVKVTLNKINIMNKSTGVEMVVPVLKFDKA